MMDYTIEIINSQQKLIKLVGDLAAVSAFALDIETVNWWNRQRERVALIQIAFASGSGAIKIAVIDALAGLDLIILKTPLESDSITKIIHNAAFDATRLLAHYEFKTAPIFDTMIAARRSGEKKYSLQAQVFRHLNLRLDKGARASDWSRRPLDIKQINYAALDAYAAFGLYRHQTARNLNGWYRLRSSSSSESLQGRLPLEELPEPTNSFVEPNVLPISQNEVALNVDASASGGLSKPLAALLGIVSELPTRYSPDALIVSVGSERVGLAGWIVDRMLGRETDFDEESARLAVAELFERQFVRLTETRRLEATEEGTRIWRKIMPV